MRHQRGGTFLGFILGVLVGLGAALVVAVYVTKVPVPFVNKSQSRTPEQDAAESRKNKDWDPNAPLYGKNPAARAPVAAASGAAPETAAAPEPAQGADKSAAKAGAAKTDPKADAKVDVKTDPKAAAGKPDARPASADPLGDLARAKSGTAEPFTYYVQVGAFRQPEEAETQRAKLTMMGVEAKVSEREQSGRMVYRVRVGPFEQRDEAEKARDKLDGAGLETTMVKVQR